MTTAANLLREMASFVHVDPALIRNAERANINETNSAGFCEILEGWCEGRYDEDPEYVVDEISQLL